MKGLIYGVVGAVVGSIVVGSLGLAAICVVALGGTLAYVGMQSQPEVVAAVDTTPARSRSRARTPASGQLRVQTMAAIQMQIDGVPMEYDRSSGSFVATIPSGRHHIQVYNAWMKEVARHDVDIRGGRRLILKYHNPDRAFLKVSETRYDAPTPQPQRVVQVAQPAPQPAAPQIQQVTQVQQVVAPAPEPKRGLGGFLAGLSVSGENSSTQRNSSSSTQYGEVRTNAPGRQEVHGYENNQSNESEQKRKRFFRL